MGKVLCDVKLKLDWKYLHEIPIFIFNWRLFRHEWADMVRYWHYQLENLGSVAVFPTLSTQLQAFCVFSGVHSLAVPDSVSVSGSCTPALAVTVTKTVTESSVRCVYVCVVVWVLHAHVCVCVCVCVSVCYLFVCFWSVVHLTSRGCYTSLRVLATCHSPFATALPSSCHAPLPPRASREKWQQ